MSRIGRAPVAIPENINVKINGNQVVVKGPNGELTKDFHPDMQISRRDGNIVVERPTDNQYHRSLHGLTRALIANMVEGVIDGFEKELEIRGVGYRAQMQGRMLVLSVGYSHPVEIEPPEGITIEVGESGTDITVKGPDKQLVGQLAARIRDVRPPEPYKGKGIRYKGEHVRRKPGKAGKVGLGM